MRGRGMMRAWSAWRLLMCRRLRDKEEELWEGGGGCGDGLDLC